MRAVSLGFVLCSLATINCLGPDDEGKGEEEELLDDSKEDSHRKPTDHGPIGFSERAVSALTDTERYHAWSFELSGDAAVTMTTSYAVLGQRRTDTVLYLYKEGPTGWGRYIARNDDYDGKVYSQLVESLDAGRYRVLVKGFAASTRGKFSLEVGCEGAGCTGGTFAECVFGQTYGDLDTAPALERLGELVVTAANLDTLSRADQDKLVKAVQQSSHTDVTTPEEALARVDQQEINVTFLVEPAAQRAFIAFEYGAGDNSYGAIFERTSGAMVTAIHDGDLVGCTARAETCLLPDDWFQMRNDPTYVKTAGRVVTSPAQLSTLETAQALAMFAREMEVTTVADGLANTDGNQLNVVDFTHTPTGRQVTVLEYGAGDTSVGAVYFRGTTDVAGRINDLAIEGCTFFE